jgi:hypothetical protein
VISGNLDAGIYLYGNTAGTTIQGNHLGTDFTGGNALANIDGNIYLDGSGTNTIGGSAPGAGNLISATVSDGMNTADGIYVTGAGANGNTIQGNFIGTKADGFSPLGNAGHGIEFANTASNNLVGGKTASADNRIAYAVTTKFSGVRVRAGCLGNFISRNCVFSNGNNSPNGLGIDLLTNGVTLSNLTVLTEAVSGGGMTILQGSMSYGHPNGQFLIQFYANGITNISGYGEGFMWIGSTNITTSAGGAASFALALPVAVSPGNFISATATDSANTTWEFGPDLVVAPPPSLGVFQSVPGILVTTNPVTHLATTSSVPMTITATWPTSPTGFVLEQTTNLTPPVNWSAATNSVTVQGTTNSITLAPSGTEMFYQLLFQ